MSKALVIGAAKSGVAAANWLAAHDASVRLTDRDANPPLPYPVDSRVERAFGVHDLSLLDGITQIVLSPGVPLTIPLLQEAMARGIEIIGEIELAYRSLKGTVIAVTGSNGKST